MTSCDAKLLAPYGAGPGTFGPAEAGHLLRRAAFGASPARLEQAVSAGLEATLEELVAAAAAPNADPEQARIEAFGLLPLVQAFLVGRALSPDGSAPARARLAERLMWVWHGHFATSDHKVRDPVLMHRQLELLRRLGGGDFRALVRALLVDGAMLVWLDGALNTAGDSNENLARELLELFCLGRGNYTEIDVREAARGLSGWRVEGRRVWFDPERFDAGEKRLLGQRGPLDAMGVADAVLAHPAAPRWVARRLISSFVCDAPWPELEAELAGELVRREFQILPTLRTLLASKAFFDPAVRANKIASPLEFVLRARHALDLELAPEAAVRLCSAAGQAPLLPPSVKGWDGGAAWAHQNAWLARGRAAVELARLAGEPPGTEPLDVARAWAAALWPGAGEPAWWPALEAALRRAAPEPCGPFIAEALLRAPEAHLI